jgi:hypothetical protein
VGEHRPGGLEDPLEVALCVRAEVGDLDDHGDR